MPTYVCSAAARRLTPVQKTEIVRSITPSIMRRPARHSNGEGSGLAIAHGSAVSANLMRCEARSQSIPEIAIDTRSEKRHG